MGTSTGAVININKSKQESWMFFATQKDDIYRDPNYAYPGAGKARPPLVLKAALGYDQHDSKAAILTQSF